MISFWVLTVMYCNPVGCREFWAGPEHSTETQCIHYMQNSFKVGGAALYANCKSKKKPKPSEYGGYP